MHLRQLLVDNVELQVHYGHLIELLFRCAVCCCKTVGSRETSATVMEKTLYSDVARQGAILLAIPSNGYIKFIILADCLTIAAEEHYRIGFIPGVAQLDNSGSRLGYLGRAHQLSAENIANAYVSHGTVRLPGTGAGAVTACGLDSPQADCAPQLHAGNRTQCGSGRAAQPCCNRTCSRATGKCCWRRVAWHVSAALLWPPTRHANPTALSVANSRCDTKAIINVRFDESSRWRRPSDSTMACFVCKHIHALRWTVMVSILIAIVLHFGLQERAWMSAGNAVQAGEAYVRNAIANTVSAFQNLESGATVAALTAAARLIANWASEPETREAVAAIGATEGLSQCYSNAPPFMQLLRETLHASHNCMLHIINFDAATITEGGFAAKLCQCLLLFCRTLEHRFHPHTAPHSQTLYSPACAQAEAGCWNGWCGKPARTQAARCSLKQSAPSPLFWPTLLQPAAFWPAAAPRLGCWRTWRRARAGRRCGAPWRLQWAR